MKERLCTPPKFGRTARGTVLFLFFFALSNASGGDSLVYVPPDTLRAAAHSSRWDSAASLDKMVITGTRTLRSVKDNPSAVFVIPREQLEASPANNVSDALLYQPGIVVQRSVGMGEGVPTSINLRGVPPATAASRTLILVDGIPTNAAGTPFLILNEIPLESIDRIEVVEGPYSGLYGPNAFGGVVNIITRNPAPGLHGEISGAGISGYYDCDGQASVAVGRFSLLVNAAARGIDNWTGRDSVDHPWIGRDSADQPVAQHDRFTNTDNYGYYDRRFFGKLSYALSSRATLTLHARYFNSDLGFGTTEYGHPPGRVSVLGQKFLVGPALKMNVTPQLDLRVSGYVGSLLGTYYGQGIRKDSTLDTVGSVWKSQSNDIEAEAQSILRLGSRNTLTAGIDFVDNIIDFGALHDPITGELLYDPNSPTGRADSAKKSMMNGGVYAQDELKLGRVTGIAAARLDYNSVFGAAICPKAGLVYKQNDMLRLKLSLGRAFRAPSLAELYMPDLPINTSSTLVANPSLVPEYVWTVDGGPEIEFAKVFDVRVEGFYNIMNDLITQKVVNQYYQGFLQNALLGNENIENAWSAGAEASMDVRLPGWGMIFCNYTFTQSENERMHGSLDYVPRHEANAGIFFGKSFGRVTVSGSILENFVGSRDYLDWQVAAWDTTRALPANPQDFTPEYVTLPFYFRTDASVKVEYRMVWIGMQCLNLTDATIEEQSGTWSPRRFVAGKIGVTF